MFCVRLLESGLGRCACGDGSKRIAVVCDLNIQTEYANRSGDEGRQCCISGRIANHREPADERVAADGKTISFETFSEGNHGIGDAISIDHPDIGGIYEETAWSITLGAGELMKHTAKRTVIA